MAQSLLIVLFGLSVFIIALYGIMVVLPGRKNKGIIWLFVFALSAFSMCVNPDPYWDLYRHYLYLDQIRVSGIGFFDFLFNNTMRVGGADYVGLIGFNILRYVVVLFGDNRLLVFFTTLITYSIWCYITLDWAKEHPMKKLKLFYITLICFVLMPYIYVNSGLRNTTASAIATLAVYLGVYRDKGLLITLLLLGISCTFHMAAGLVMMAYIVYLLYIKNHAVAFIAMVGVFFVVPILAEWAVSTDYDYLRKLGSYFNIYFNRDKSLTFDNYAVAVHILLIPIVITLVQLNFTRLNQYLLVPEKRLASFMVIHVLFSLFYLGQAIFIQRAMYVFGVMSAPLVFFMYDDMLYGKKGGGNRERVLFFAVILALILIMRKDIPEYLLSSWF